MILICRTSSINISSIIITTSWRKFYQTKRIFSIRYVQEEEEAEVVVVEVEVELVVVVVEAEAEAVAAVSVETVEVEAVVAM